MKKSRLDSVETEERRAYAEKLDWSSTSGDYLKYRTQYPEAFFPLLKALGIGLPGQRILDLACGVGTLTIPLAKSGAEVTGVDFAEGQIEALKTNATAAGLTIPSYTVAAEETGLPSGSFDIISASLCWYYFDLDRMIPEVYRLLVDNGRLLICTSMWQSDHGGIADISSDLVTSYNPFHRENRRAVREVPIPPWSRDDFVLKTYHEFRAPITFDRVSWRGRLRATKWISAQLNNDKVQEFDAELAKKLEAFPEHFDIPHQVQLWVFGLK